MGKAAENELIKLTAAWYNNVSVGLILTGVLIPLFSLYRAENFQLLHDWTSGKSPPTPPQILQLLLAFVAFFLALAFSGYFQEAARKEIAKLQD
jgi:hypothetical protein